MSVRNRGIDLVTGATGFIGRHLTERLLGSGAKVRILVRTESEHKVSPCLRQHADIVRGDLGDPESLRQATRGASRVFHCAGYVLDWGRSSDYLDANVEGTRLILEASADAKVERFVHLSSIAVFGVPSPVYFDDETPHAPGRDHYSRTKSEGEKLVLRYHAEERLNVTVLRPAVVYGVGGTWAEEPIKMIRKKRMFLIDHGHGVCHPCYIENLIDAIILAAEHPAALGQAFIVADDEPITFGQYFNALSQIAGSGLIHRSIPFPAARLVATICEAAARLWPRRARPLLTHTAINMVTARSRMSMEKIKRELGYRPRFSVTEAMREMAHKL